MTDVIRLLRDLEARRDSQFRYAEAHDKFASLEQRYVADGNTVEAEGAHEFALLCLKAYRNEIDDPDPSVASHDDDVREGWER